jgi:signal transduction histidine kinase
LLAFSRKQALLPQLTKFNDLVTGMTELLQRTLGETIDIEAGLDPSAWPTMVDPHQLENAILNLAINARDAMPGGGTLTIKTSNQVRDEAYQTDHPNVDPGQYVMLAVSDTAEHGLRLRQTVRWPRAYR